MGLSMGVGRLVPRCPARHRPLLGENGSFCASRCFANFDGPAGFYCFASYDEDTGEGVSGCDAQVGNGEPRAFDSECPSNLCLGAQGVCRRPCGSSTDFASNET